MRTSLYLLGIILAMASLTGCKPKQTTLTGQMFIATKGMENVKLGAVTVFLIEKQKATNALQRAIEKTAQSAKTKFQTQTNHYAENLSSARAKIQMLTDQLPEEQRVVEAAQVQLNEAQQKYKQYVATQPLRTNAVYVKLYNDLVSLNALAASQQDNIKTLRETVSRTAQSSGAYYVPSYRPGESGYWRQDSEAARVGLNQSTQTYLASAQNDLKNTYAEIERDQQEMADIVQEVNSFQEAKVRDVETLLGEAQTRVSTTDSALASANFDLQKLQDSQPVASTPGLEELFANFAPTDTVKTETDANGNFSLSYPENIKYMLYAHAERATPSGVEKYIWLIDAPSTRKTVSVLLDNNNLLEIDHDGYLTGLAFLSLTP